MTIHSVLIQKLLSTNAHLGRHIAANHFKIFTYGSRNGMTIIDSDKTIICVRNACYFIGTLARQKAQFLFVNTNSLYDEIFEQMTKRIGCKFDNRWRVGGFLTNSYSPKKFRSRKKKFIIGPSRMPDCVVIVDTERKSSVIAEADKLQIPIVALVDSSMPSETYEKITYPIPANDHSVQFVYLFCNLITKTVLLEQKRLAGLKDTVSEEADIQQLAPLETDSRDEAQQIEQRKIDSANDEVLVVPYESISPISNDPAETKKLLDKLVVLRFNDILGTKMGFNGPKSAIQVCNGLTFLDLIINQIESINSKYECRVPLLLVNTNKTHNDTLKVLEKHSGANIDVHNFNQNQDPQVKSFEGLINEDELCQSDHGEALLYLMKSGTLDVLLGQGKEYILMVNPDNLTGVADPKILNYLIQNQIEYCMEVTPTTIFGFKGSAVNYPQGKFLLADITQSHSKHSAEKFKFIDTKHLWVNLKAIKRLVETDPLWMENFFVSKEKNSKLLLQETTTGSSVRFFDHAVGINIPQSQFLPFESTSDLLLVQSDLYTIDEGVLVRNKGRKNPVNPCIELGPEFEKVSDFLSRFKSVPSIVELDSLRVTGDVWFGADTTLKGKVNIAAKPGIRLEIPDGAVLENKEINGPWDI
ncbi:UTP--glucose-1-phosphate uridylyltransferase-like isoform X2 [Malania oleifera]|uniref:UTP--glucose-1-phosphate uridylyltransferase-like isoform X2 n=1 Tax=Malania oleifera TaxID=397392 RepID=UPI0025AE0BD7|nr:UTP--glucose-1-phosphate uridylyltransferase-like isoform X2 [Malania oleifera]